MSYRSVPSLLPRQLGSRGEQELVVATDLIISSSDHQSCGLSGRQNKQPHMEILVGLCITHHSLVLSLRFEVKVGVKAGPAAVIVREHLKN